MSKVVELNARIASNMDLITNLKAKLLVLSNNSPKVVEMQSCDDAISKSLKSIEIHEADILAWMAELDELPNTIDLIKQKEERIYVSENSRILDKQKAAHQEFNDIIGVYNAARELSIHENDWLEWEADRLAEESSNMIKLRQQWRQLVNSEIQENKRIRDIAKNAASTLDKDILSLEAEKTILLGKIDACKNSRRSVVINYYEAIQKLESLRASRKTLDDEISMVLDGSLINQNFAVTLKSLDERGLVLDKAIKSLEGDPVLDINAQHLAIGKDIESAKCEITIIERKISYLRNTESSQFNQMVKGGKGGKGGIYTEEPALSISNIIKAHKAAKLENDSRLQIAREQLIHIETTHDSDKARYREELNRLNHDAIRAEQRKQIMFKRLESRLALDKSRISSNIVDSKMAIVALRSSINELKNKKEQLGLILDDENVQCKQVRSEILKIEQSTAMLERMKASMQSKKTIA